MKKQVGALWKKSYDKNGEKVSYLSGNIDLGALGQVSIAVFKNERKEKDTHPDYRIVLSEKRNGDGPPDEYTETTVF